MTDRERRMTNLFIRAAAKVQKERLPGWEAFIATNADASKHIKNTETNILTRFSDEDEVLFTKDLGSWVRSWGRVNEVLAEQYRKENINPNEWQLRYIKWMKIVYIRFESEKGEFYLLPRRPSKKPRVKHWYTVDEMLDMLIPEVSSILSMSDELPLRPGSEGKPPPGEKHLHIDFTGKKTSVRYELGRMNSDRKRLR